MEALTPCPRWQLEVAMVRLRKWTIRLGVAAAVFLAFAQTARAEGENTEGVVYKKTTVVSFDDDTIDGDLMKPDGAYVESRKRVRHSNLIKIRENFRAQILSSVSEI